MKSNQSGLIWPYLAVVLGLFTLGVTAPRSWQRMIGGAVGTSRQLAESTPDAIARIALGERPSGSEPLRTTHLGTARPLATATAPRAAVEPVVQPVATPVRPTQSAPVVRLVEPTVKVSTPSDRLAMRPNRRRLLPTISPPAGRLRDQAGRGTSAAPASEQQVWTRPEILLEALRRLADNGATEGWAERAADLIERLAGLPLGGASATEGTLQALAAHAEGAQRLAARIEAGPLRDELLRTSFALERRVRVWRPAASAAGADTPRTDLSVRQVPQQVAQLAALTSRDPLGKAWHDFLMLDALADAAARPSGDEKQQQVARALLARLDSAALTPAQRQFLASRPIAELSHALRFWATGPVDVPGLLDRIEAYEASGRVSDARDLADACRSLAGSSRPADRELAAHVDRQYRNANIRVAISADLLNGWLPDQPGKRQAVRDHILGADVKGQSFITTRLAVQLVPDPERIQFDLVAHGLVRSATSASSGPATFYSKGRTHYSARKRIVMSRDGTRVGPSIVRADGRSDLLGLDTDFDGVPLIRSLVRGIALSQHEQSQGKARARMERKVAANVRVQLDRAAGQQLAAAQANLRERVLRPLDELAVDVAPVALATTDKRIVMRLRLAGEDHLGAHTPRPCALGGSLASMQLHESVLNNMVARLKLEGRTFRLTELYTTVAETLGWLTDVPEDLPERVRVTFADQDAVQLRCSDGRVAVTLNIAKVSHGRTRYENFQVKAFYRGSTSPEGAELVRDGTIRLAGHLKAGPQLVLRSVFSKLFSQHSRPSILKTGAAGDARLATLAVQQLEIEGGWIGMSLGAAPKLQTAARATSRPLR